MGRVLFKVPRHPYKWFPRCLASLDTMSCYATKTGKFADRVFAPYSVFKGKAALSVEPVLPTFSKFGVSITLCCSYTSV